MYVNAMLSQQPMPLSDSKNVSWEYTYINVGWISWDAPAENRFEFGTETSGLAWDIVMTNMYNGPFTFIVPPFGIGTKPLATLVNICEDQTACLVLSSWTSTKAMVICTVDSDGQLPADCRRRGRLAGSRRFSNLLGVLFDSTTVAMSALDTYHVIGTKSIVIIAESPYFSQFPADAVLRTEEFAKQLSLKVVGKSIMVQCDTNTTMTDTNQTNCPRSSTTGQLLPGMSQILPDGHTPTTYAAWLKSLDPDALIMITSTSGQSAATFASLFDGFRAVDWTPKMINWAGGGDTIIRPYMTNYNDLLYTLSTQPWDSRLTGPQYRNLKTDVNFELFPAEEELDAPAVFAREFGRRYDQYYPGGKLDFSAAGNVMTVLGFQALNFAQKLIESALSASIVELVMTSLKVSTPSVYHQLEFDVTGRTKRVNEVLLQMTQAPNPTDNHALVVVAPYNIGQAVIHPMPTWAEREFHPKMYSRGLEITIAVITGVSILICVILCALLMKHRKHTVIRAATPSFCVLTIVGAIMMLTSTFFHTTVASDSHCAAHIWLLSIGFSVLWSALFIKTARVYRITSSRNMLMPVRMRDVDLLMAVGLFVTIDIVINTAWHIAIGMETKTIVYDPIRPMYNRIVCDYADSNPFIFTHLALKFALLLFGIILTWLVRSAPTIFNESSFIAICMYNIMVVLMFLVPMEFTSVGGYEYGWFIRAAAIIFVCISTVSVLYIPKLANIYLLHLNSSGDETPHRLVHFDSAHSKQRAAAAAGAGAVKGTKKQLHQRRAPARLVQVDKEVHLHQPPQYGVDPLPSGAGLPTTGSLVSSDDYHSSSLPLNHLVSFVVPLPPFPSRLAPGETNSPRTSPGFGVLQIPTLVEEYSHHEEGDGDGAGGGVGGGDGGECEIDLMIPTTPPQEEETNHTHNNNHIIDTNANNNIDGDPPNQSSTTPRHGTQLSQLRLDGTSASASASVDPIHIELTRIGASTPALPFELPSPTSVTQKPQQSDE